MRRTRTGTQPCQPFFISVSQCRRTSLRKTFKSPGETKRSSVFTLPDPPLAGRALNCRGRLCFSRHGWRRVLRRQVNNGQSRPLPLGAQPSLAGPPVTSQCEITQPALVQPLIPTVHQFEGSGSENLHTGLHGNGRRRSFASVPELLRFPYARQRSRAQSPCHGSETTCAGEEGFFSLNEKVFYFGLAEVCKAAVPREIHRLNLPVNFQVAVFLLLCCCTGENTASLKRKGQRQPKQ